MKALLFTSSVLAWALFYPCALPFFFCHWLLPPPRIAPMQYLLDSKWTEMCGKLSFKVATASAVQRLSLSLSLMPPSLYHLLLLLLLSVSSFVTVCHFASSQSWAYLYQTCTPPHSPHCVQVRARRGRHRSLRLSQEGEMARERLKLCLVIMKG